jgi:hypothetical protein
MIQNKTIIVLYYRAKIILNLKFKLIYLIIIVKYNLKFLINLMTRVLLKHSQIKIYKTIPNFK